MPEARIVTLDGSNLEDTESLNLLYCEVWKEPPWLEFFWTHEVVKEYIVDTQNKTNSIWLLVKLQDELIGFALGYEVDIATMRTICSHKKLDFLFDQNRRLLYDAEVAVLSKYRRLGFGTRLMQEKIKHARQIGCQSYIVRTKADSAKAMLRKLGFHDTMVPDGSDPERTYWQLEL